MMYKKRENFEAYQWNGDFSTTPGWLLPKVVGENNGELIIEVEYPSFGTNKENAINVGLKQGDYAMEDEDGLVLVNKEIFERQYEPIAATNTVNISINIDKDLDVSELMKNIKTLSERGNLL